MSCKVDTRKYNAMCLDLSRITGAPFSKVVDGEVAKTVEKAVRDVPAAKVSNLRDSADYRAHSAAERAQLFKVLKAARGLAKQGLWLISKMLGTLAKAPAYVPEAKPSDGKKYQDVSVARKLAIWGYRVHVESRQPTLFVRYVGGAAAFTRAIAGRVKFFETNLKKKVFDSVKGIAKRYPGIRTH